MFDKKAYRTAVLLPLTKNPAQVALLEATLRGVRDATDDASLLETLGRTDIAALFGVTPGLSGTDLVQQLKSVEMLLNGLGDKNAVARTLTQLLQALKAKAGDTWSTSQFWTTLAEAAARANKGKLVAFATALKQDRPLGVVSADQVRKAASAHGIPTSVSEKELVAAVTSQGVEVCPEFDAPDVRTDAAPLQNQLDPSFRGILDVVLLHQKGGRPDDIRVIDELSAAQIGGARGRIGLGDVRESKAFADTRSGNATESAKKTLNKIIELCPTDEDLRKLALAWYIELADLLVRRQGLMTMAALERLKDTGLADLDARRILSRADTGSSGPGVNDVTALIAQGDLRGARRVLTALTGEDTGGGESAQVLQVTAALEAAEAQKRRALDAYRQAMDVQDFAGARQALADARAVDREDPEVDRFLQQIPPDPPSGLQASYSPDTGGVLLSWRAAPAADVRFAVVRSEAGVPANPTSGHRITAGTTAMQAVDTAPAFARNVTYAVFALAEGTGYSSAATVSLVVLPPPSSIRTAVTTGDATVFWHVPPQATGVTVDLMGADGTRRTFPATSTDRLLVDGLVLGQKYAITLTAHYVVNGRTAQSNTVSVDVTPRGTAHPVQDLRVTEVSLPDGRPGVRAEWTEVRGYSTDLWSLPVDCSLRTGGQVGAGKLDELTGKRVVGSLQGSGAHQLMDFHPLTDIRALFPITWDGETGIVGSPVTAGTAPPPRNLEAVRFGSELVVSWVWPHGDYEIDATWSDRDRRLGQARLDRLTYRRNNGLRIPEADQVTEVHVGTVASGGGREFTGSPVTVHVDAVAPAVSYEMHLPRGPFGGHNAKVSVTSETFRGTAELVAILTPGSFMPARPEDGQQIAQLRLDFSGARTQTAVFQVPRIKGPFWVRLFPAREGSFLLEDPPTSFLKG